jgi:hypothetical protein
VHRGRFEGCGWVRRSTKGCSCGVQEGLLRHAGTQITGCGCTNNDATHSSPPLQETLKALIQK